MEREIDGSFGMVLAHLAQLRLIWHDFGSGLIRWHDFGSRGAVLAHLARLELIWHGFGSFDTALAHLIRLYLV